MPSGSNIPANRADLTEASVSPASRAWYTFFQYVYNLVGGGQSTLTLLDLQQAPPAATADSVAVLANALQDLQEAPSNSALLSQVATLTKAVQGLQQAPPVLPQLASTTVIPTIDYGGAATNGGGNATVTFSKTFTSPPYVVVTCTSTALEYVANQNGPTTTQVAITTWQGGVTAGGIGFNWIAIGT